MNSFHVLLISPSRRLSDRHCVMLLLFSRLFSPPPSLVILIVSECCILLILCASRYNIGCYFYFSYLIGNVPLHLSRVNEKILLSQMGKQKRRRIAKSICDNVFPICNYSFGVVASMIFAVFCFIDRPAFP